MEWDCYATELTLLFLTLESLSAISFFLENKSQKAPPNPHGMLQAPGAYGAPRHWPGHAKGVLYPPYDPYAAGYPFSVALSDLAASKHFSGVLFYSWWLPPKFEQLKAWARK